MSLSISFIEEFTTIYTTCDSKLTIHCIYEAIILQHHQINPELYKGTKRRGSQWGDGFYG